MALKSEYFKRGFSKGKISSKQGREFKKKFTDAFKFSGLNNESVPNTEEIRTNKSGIFLSTHSLIQLVSDINELGGHGMKLSFALDDDNNLQLVGEIISLDLPNNTKGDFSHTELFEKDFPYYTETCQHCEPKGMDIPPFPTFGPTSQIGHLYR